MSKIIENHGLPCAVCGRRAGYAPKNRFGEPDLSPDVPLGDVTTCPFCGRLSCPDCQAERECCDMPEIVAAVGMPDIQPKPPPDGKERAMKQFCDNPNCDNPAVKKVRVSVALPSDQKRSLCAACEESYAWGVQHGVMTSWRPVWVLAVADRGVVVHVAVFRKKKDAEEGLVEYLRTYHGYSGLADRKAVRRWLGEHDERLSVEISEQVIASPPE